MEFGAEVSLIGPGAEQTEDIYVEEIEDGLAECAHQQAKVWAAAVAANEVTGDIDKQFIDELVRMSQNLASDKKCQEQHQDAQASHTGVFSSVNRLQPRYHAGAAAKFDKLVKKRIRQENKIRQLSAAQRARLKAVLKAPPPSSVQLPTTPAFPMAFGKDNQSVDPNEDDEPPALVVVNEPIMQVGFGGEDAPRVAFTAVVGRPRHQGVMVGMGQKDAYVGDEAQSKRGILTMKYPMDRGHIINWDDMGKIWHHSFYNELRVSPEEHPVLISQGPVASPAEREKLVQMMFETFNVPLLNVVSSAQLAAVSYGTLTALVIEMGEDATSIVPIHQGHVVHEAVLQCTVGQHDVVDYLMKIMTERGFSFTTTAERDIVRDICNKCCFVAEDFESELRKDAKVHDKSYELPDGQVLHVSNERFRAFEVFFQPSIIGIEDGFGIDVLASAAVALCPQSIRAQLYKNIVVAGWGSAIPGLTKRLQQDVSSCVPSGTTVEVARSPSSKYAAWTGGSILSSMLALNKDGWISREEYDSTGPTIVHQKCPGSSAAPGSLASLFDAAPQSDIKSQAKLQAPDSLADEKQSDKQVQPSQPQRQPIKHTMTSPNVVCVSMSQLAFPPHKMLDAPLPQCEECHARLGPFSRVEDDVWICEFCDTENDDIDVDGLPVGFTQCSVVEHIEQPPTDPSSTFVYQGVKADSTQDRSVVIFCLDVSGSMGVTMMTEQDVEIPQNIPRIGPKNQVSRMQLVQAAVHAQLEHMAKHFPNQRPVLIAFSNVVTVYGDGSQAPVQIPSKIETDYEALLQFGRALPAQQHVGRTAQQCNAELVDKVDRLEPTGATALGPAVAVAMGIAAEYSSSKIIVCTDGLANTGIGSLEVRKSQKAAVREMYMKMGAYAQRQSATINIMSIRGTDCNLENVGLLADATAGSVDIVNPLELDKQFMSVMSKPTLGSGVSCRVRTHDSMVWDKSKTSTALSEIGNVTADIDIVFQYSPSAQAGSAPLVKTVPFQAEISYSRPDGARVLRWVFAQHAATTDRSTVESSLHGDVVALYAVQSAAALAQSGNYKDARMRLISTQRLLQRAMHDKTAQHAYIQFIVQGERLDGFMRQAQQQEQLVFGMQAANERASERDDAAAKNIVQMKSCPLSRLRPSGNAQPGLIAPPAPSAQDDEKAQLTVSAAAAAKEDAERTQCRICLDRPVQLVYAPCRHAVSCSACYEQQRLSASQQAVKCAVCRAEITSADRVFI